MYNLEDYTTYILNMQFFITFLLLLPTLHFLYIITRNIHCVQSIQILHINAHNVNNYFYTGGINYEKTLSIILCLALVILSFTACSSSNALTEENVTKQ